MGIFNSQVRENNPCRKFKQRTHAPGLKPQGASLDAEPSRMADGRSQKGPRLCGQATVALDQPDGGEQHD